MRTKQISVKNLRLLLCLTALLAGLGWQTASAKDAPASAELLRDAFESALKAKDTNALTELFQWQGVSGHMQTMMNAMVAELPRHDWVTVKLVPLPADNQATNELNGIRYRPSVPVIGLINVEFAQKGNSMQLPYGKSGDAFYLACAVEEKLPGTFTKAKALAIMVMGTVDIKSVTGSCVFVQNGKEIKKNISERGTSFFGDYIKSCSVQKTTDDEDSIQVTITENGKSVFESEDVTNRTPVIYERK